MLTDVSIKKVIREAKTTHSTIKKFDSPGLHVIARPTGAAQWRSKYDFQGREQLISLCDYSDVPLMKAREKCEAPRKLVVDGVNPSAKREAEKLANANSVLAVATEWLAKQTQLDPITQDTARARLARHMDCW